MGAIRSGGGSGGGRGGGGGSGGGEIVPVQGGHILRSTGRKDRHSKVFTAKGPRDRRVRLAAHTAIQFYDVQDRLGYDRPSKAVDWLIKNAKSAIDKLTELPPWQPNPNNLTNTHLVAGPTETPETPDFVPEASPIDPAIEMVINSRSQDLGLSLHPYNQTGPGPKWGLGFGFERDEFVYSDNNHLASSSSADFHQRGALQSSVTTAFHGFDGYGGPGSEDQHKAAAAAQSMVQQSLLLGGRFGSDGFPGFCVPVISHDDGEDVSSSRAPSSFYAWSNGGHNSLLKNK